MQNCDYCGNELKVTIDYSGQEDLLGSKIPPGIFCSIACLAKHIADHSKE